MIIFRLLIKQYDGKMSSITQEGGDKRFAVITSPTKIINISQTGSTDVRRLDQSPALKYQSVRRKRLDGMPKNSLGKGHGGRVGGYNWVSYFGVNTLINKTKQFQLFYHKKLMMPVW